MSIAIMGCAVNGPGEAKESDIGLACGKGFGILFAKGEVIRKVSESEMVVALLSEINRLEKEYLG